MWLAVAATFVVLGRRARLQRLESPVTSGHVANRAALCCVLEAVYPSLAAVVGPGMLGRTGHLYAWLLLVILGVLTFWLMVGGAEIRSGVPPASPRRSWAGKYRAGFAMALLAAGGVVGPLWILAAKGFSILAGVDFDRPSRGQPGEAWFDFLFFLSLPFMAVLLVWVAVVLLAFVAYKTAAITKEEAWEIVGRWNAPVRWQRPDRAA